MAGNPMGSIDLATPIKKKNIGDNNNKCKEKFVILKSIGVDRDHSNKK